MPVKKAVEKPAEKQSKVRKDLANLKSWPTEIMTETQQKAWEDLLQKKAIYFPIIAKYNQGHRRNINRNVQLNQLTKRLQKVLDPKGVAQETKDYLEFICPNILDAFYEKYSIYPRTPIEFADFLTSYLKKNPEEKEEFYKQNEIFDAPAVVPPEILAHIKEYEDNKKEGKIQIVSQGLDIVNQKIAQSNEEDLYSRIRNRSKPKSEPKFTYTITQKPNKQKKPKAKLLSADELDLILTGTSTDTSDNHNKFGKKYGEGLMNLLSKEEQDETNYQRLQNKRFELMVDKIKDFDALNQKQILNTIINDEEEMELSDEECVYDHDQLREYMKDLDNKTESFTLNIPKVKSLTESFYELINKRLDSKTLTEDDSPADFASGLNNAVTSNSGVDMSAGDTSTTSSDTSSSSTSSSSTPEFDYAPDSGDTSGFGGITGPGGMPKDIPDDDMNSIPIGEYRVIDILVNDKDTSKVKVKIQNIETKEVETVDLSEIDV